MAAPTPEPGTAAVTAPEAAQPHTRRSRWDALAAAFAPRRCDLLNGPTHPAGAVIVCYQRSNSPVIACADPEAALRKLAELDNCGEKGCAADHVAVFVAGGRYRVVSAARLHQLAAEWKTR